MLTRAEITQIIYTTKMMNVTSKAKLTTPALRATYATSLAQPVYVTSQAPLTRPAQRTMYLTSLAKLTTLALRAMCVTNLAVLQSCVTSLHWAYLPMKSMPSIPLSLTLNY